MFHEDIIDYENLKSERHKRKNVKLKNDLCSKRKGLKMSIVYEFAYIIINKVLV